MSIRSMPACNTQTWYALNEGSTTTDPLSYAASTTIYNIWTGEGTAGASGTPVLTFSYAGTATSAVMKAPSGNPARWYSEPMLYDTVQDGSLTGRTYVTTTITGSSPSGAPDSADSGIRVVVGKREPDGTETTICTGDWIAYGFRLTSPLTDDTTIDFTGTISSQTVSKGDRLFMYLEAQYTEDGDKDFTLQVNAGSCNIALPDFYAVPNNSACFESRTFYWHVNTYVEQSAEFLWDTLVSVEQSSESLWNVYTKVEQDCEVLWDTESILTPVEQTCESLWNVDDLVRQTCEFTYYVQVGVMQSMLDLTLEASQNTSLTLEPTQWTAVSLEEVA